MTEFKYWHTRAEYAIGRNIRKFVVIGGVATAAWLGFHYKDAVVTAYQDWRLKGPPLSSVTSYDIKSADTASNQFLIKSLDNNNSKYAFIGNIVGFTDDFTKDDPTRQKEESKFRLHPFVDSNKVTEIAVEEENHGQYGDDKLVCRFKVNTASMTEEDVKKLDGLFYKKGGLLPVAVYLSTAEIKPSP